MRSVLRHLQPLVRSRRRVPFILIVITLICIAIIVHTIDRNPLDTITDNIHLQTQKITPTSALLNAIVEKKPVQSVKSGKSVDEQGRSVKTHFVALDWTGFFGSAAGEGEKVQCPSSNTTFVWTRQQNRIKDVDFVVCHDAGSGIPFDKLQLDENQQQYSMAFVMESEVHSSTGNSWARFKFKMTYNLDDSYPEPATYFDMHTHLIDLLRPAAVSFQLKEKDADVVWIISNCNAQNGREGFVQRLMHEMPVHSYGACLNNRHGYQSRMTDNIDAYKKYKFVVAIENSNCADYVTEKLVKAVASGSIPIVAGRNGRPDYRRYMPDHSFINIFDYPSVKALADELKRIATNQTLYESYLWYKNHDKDVSKLQNLPLDDKLKHVAEVIGANSTMLVSGIAAKEKSENKVCKMIRFVRETPWKEIAAHKGTARADAGTACLQGQSIIAHFDSNGRKNNQSLSSSLLKNVPV